MRPGGSIMGCRGKPQPERTRLDVNLRYPVSVEIYEAHGETTKSVMDWLLKDKKKRLGRDHLSVHDRAKLERYYTWLECVQEQLHGHRMPPNFKVAYLTREHLGLTKDELRMRWKRVYNQGVSVRKVLNRLDAFNRKHGAKLRPCRPGVPFALKKLDIHGAPFHHGFVGTGLQDVGGRKSSIHIYAPLDWVHIAQSLHSQPVAWEYYDDGYWERGGAQEFVFEC